MDKNSNGLNQWAKLIVIVKLAHKQAQSISLVVCLSPFIYLNVLFLSLFKWAISDKK